MKHFITDSQTLEDLNLLGKFRKNSVFSIFNRVISRGGENLLQEMFHHPLTDALQINERSRLICFFSRQKLKFPLSAPRMEDFEQYLSIPAKSSRLGAIISFGTNKVKGLMLREETYQQLEQGILSARSLFKEIAVFLSKIEEGGAFSAQAEILKRILAESGVKSLLYQEPSARLDFAELGRIDFLLKVTLQKQMGELLGILYALDVYIAVSAVGVEQGFGYGEALSSPGGLKARGLRHPALKSGVTNDLEFNAGQKLMFLTGANMAGKSTLMKSFGIACYLAHMGFPVPAETFRFSVMDGISSSINVSDNLAMGFSHFYAEVKRVKDVAEQVASGKRLLVLFDELFKGTNVKDAYDGTFAVTEAFSKYSSCIFIISTHIIEVGTALKESGETFQFAYLPTIMEGNVPRYTYKLREGITDERQGMLIIENEGILEIIKGNK